jgi:hypothetical protein
MPSRFLRYCLNSFLAVSLSSGAISVLPALKIKTSFSKRESVRGQVSQGSGLTNGDSLLTCPFSSALSNACATNLSSPRARPSNDPRWKSSLCPSSGPSSTNVYRTEARSSRPGFQFPEQQVISYFPQDKRNQFQHEIPLHRPEAPNRGSEQSSTERDGRFAIVKHHSGRKPFSDHFIELAQPAKILESE